ncbi:MAG: penicillin-binding protein 2 [Flavobacteriales bacterium]|nr:penicillin-binding protein 2 [Flavobacteriales bacterium]
MSYGNTRYRERMYVLIAIAVFIAVVFLVRLFYIQVLDDSYRLSADNNVLRYVTQFPARGLIKDRNGYLLVYNEAAYDLMVIPRQAKQTDTAAICDILGISKADFVLKMNKAKAHSTRKASIFEKQLSVETYAELQEKMHRFDGFFVQVRTLRKYPRPIAAHIMGYVGEVNQTVIDRNPYYRSGDYIGIAGLEKSYETSLRGVKGVKVMMVDVHNRTKGSYREGRYDTLAVAGRGIECTIDAKLQEYGELLMQNKAGAIVALEPSTGEILALISTPTFDPNLLVGRVRSANYVMLNQDTLKPLFNRALMSETNPPGSTFKVLNALIGQQVGVTNEQTTIGCRGGYISGNFRMGCHPHSGPLNLRQSIQQSCNAYYGTVFRSIIDHTGKPWEGYEIWRNHVLSFGLGTLFNTDLPTEKKGIVPPKSYFDRYHGENKWKSLTIISMAIGQGDLGVTPLQLANMTATIANRGWYIPPHLVRKIEGDTLPGHFTQKQYTTVDRPYFDPVVDGMEMVFQQGGTGYRSRLDTLAMCGKTGTAQNPHGEDHSIFICFAPKDDPKIALAVFVENGGGGSKYAAPIASLMVEQYLRDTISRPAFEKVILDTDLLKLTKE